MAVTVRVDPKNISARPFYHPWDMCPGMGVGGPFGSRARSSPSWAIPWPQQGVCRADLCGSPRFPQQETGFWFIFHHVPTGPSVGMYSPGYSEHIPLGKFYNNRAHSNYRVSLSRLSFPSRPLGPPSWPADH